jgi:hypothetical protein
VIEAKKAQLRVLPPKLRTEEDLRGRVQFVLDQEHWVAWMGAAGFVLRDTMERDITAGTVSEVMTALFLS